MDYERGMKQLRELAKNTQWFIEYLTLEARLKDNLQEEKEHGKPEQILFNRSKIIKSLNHFALEHFSIDFNSLCKSEPIEEPPPKTNYQPYSLENTNSLNAFITKVSLPEFVAKNPQPSSPGTVFISSSAKDRIYLEELRAHLVPDIQSDKIVSWDDEEIYPPALWQQERKKALQAATIAILLISRDFLQSDLILQSELPYLLASRNERLEVLCVIVRPYPFQETELTRFWTANSPSQPLNAMSSNEREKVWKAVLEHVKNYLQPDTNA